MAKSDRFELPDEKYIAKVSGEPAKPSPTMQAFPDGGKGAEVIAERLHELRMAIHEYTGDDGLECVVLKPTVIRMLTSYFAGQERYAMPVPSGEGSEVRTVHDVWISTMDNLTRQAFEDGRRSVSGGGALPSGRWR